MKKLFCIVCCVFLFSCRVDSYSQEELESANYLAQKGIIQDQSQNPDSYNFGASITRREILKIMIQISGKSAPNTCSTQYFLDVTQNDWGCKYAQVAVENGYITKNTYFRPNDAISQIEALKMLMQGKGIERDENSDWRAGYVSKAYQEGVLKEKYLEYNKAAQRSWIFVTARNVYDTQETASFETADIGISEKTIKIGEDTRYYKMYAPQGDVRGYPVIMLLHGGQGSMDILDTKNLGIALQDIAKEENIVIISPNGANLDREFDSTAANWNDDRPQDSKFAIRYDVDDVTFLNTLVDSIHKKYGTSQDNVFVFGLSNGGTMIQRLLLDDGSRYTAAGIFISNLQKKDVEKNPSKQIPVLLWLGTEDPLMLYNPEESDDYIFLGAAESADWWGQKNATTSVSDSVKISSPDKNGCYTMKKVYQGINPVHFYSSVGGGHSISSIAYQDKKGPFQEKMTGIQCQDIEATQVLWDFFKSFLK